MAQPEQARARTPSTAHRTSWSWRRLFGRDDSTNTTAPLTPPLEDIQQQHGVARRLSRKVVPGLPRPGTFKRQQSELRDRLEPAKSNSGDRRTVSVDRRRNASFRSSSSTAVTPLHRLSAPELLDNTTTTDAVMEPSQIVLTAPTDLEAKDEYVEVSNETPSIDAPSISTEIFDQMISEELEKRWILNLSMHFRDKSKREKFFVTFAETPTHWRRVTISLDYRDVPEGSLEEELERTRFQREKSARIYEAIRDSLPEIQFYDTVTNLKLQTENERLHVHVVEDVSEIISYPPITAINHLNCRRVREDALVFDSHLSGFVYKVRVDDQLFIKKEIPGPDTVDEFLYEINALHQLSGSNSVIEFGGVVLDNRGEVVKGLLISFAEQGALIDVIYDGEGRIPWRRRERWAKQIVQGLSEIHEAGFVQGDFTLSNIVIDGADNAKIIDINRRGCPVGWEPPEVAALIESNQRISMYIGVKSDLYQLGMVLYALAIQQDEPETYRPLDISCVPKEIPGYYLDLCSRCLDEDPRRRSQASTLLTLFPTVSESYQDNGHPLSIAADACYSPQKTITNGHRMPSSLTLRPRHFENSEKPDEICGYAITHTSEEPDYPSRGRSPPAHFSRDRAPSIIPLSSLASGYDDGGALTTDETLEPSVLKLRPDGASTNREVDPSTYPLPDSSAGSYLDTNKQPPPLTNEAVELSCSAPKNDNTGPQYTSDMEKQPISEPRTTVAMNQPPTEYPADLAFIGTAHVAHYDIVPSANLDDDLTTETHNDRNNDRHVHEDIVVI
ncbi:protein kinase domain-containing protein [Diplocarpon rosae]|nr:protein kinase domain-containing protein [Diplocarpon rosae]